MELDAQAIIAELQQQLIVLSTRAAEYAGMVDALKKQIADKDKPALKAVD